MKKALTFLYLCAIVIAAGCNYKQLCYVSSLSGLRETDTAYVFENDTLKITYGFWDDRGAMAYAVYNKLNKPIYVDWKKSSFVLNGIKMNYWSDEARASSAGTSLSIPLYRWYGMNVTAGSSTTTVTKSERITFIAPQSKVIRGSFHLWSGYISKIPGSSKKELLAKPGHKEKVSVKTVDYTEASSPITFRNFITYSTTENFDRELYVDNGFYLSKIQEMATGDFNGRAYYDKNQGKNVRETPFFSLKRFYISAQNPNNQ